jgi:hypothetical protein
MVRKIQTPESSAVALAATLLLRRRTGASMAIDTDPIDDCVLALLLLGRHDGQRVWKSFDWDAVDRLHKKGLISDPVGRAKSVVLTTKGWRRLSDCFGICLRQARERCARNMHLICRFAST